MEIPVISSLISLNVISVLSEIVIISSRKKKPERSEDFAAPDSSSGKSRVQDLLIQPIIPGKCEKYIL